MQSNPEDMIAPCKCRRDGKWVHRACLNHWRVMSPNPSCFIFCDVCRFAYVIRREPAERRAKAGRKMFCKSLRPGAAGLFLIQLAMLVLAAMFYPLIWLRLRFTRGADELGVTHPAIITAIAYGCAFGVTVLIVSIVGLCRCCGRNDAYWNTRLLLRGCVPFARIHWHAGGKHFNPPRLPSRCRR